MQPPQQSAPYHARGRIDLPLPPEGGPNGTEDSVCFDLPYRRIVENLQNQGGGSYNLAAAQDPGGVRGGRHTTHGREDCEGETNGGDPFHHDSPLVG